jgi:hypothetical protein
MSARVHANTPSDHPVWVMLFALRGREGCCSIVRVGA